MTSALPADVGAVIDPATCTWDDDGLDRVVRRGRARARHDQRQLDVVVGPAALVEGELARLAWMAEQFDAAGPAGLAGGCRPWPAVPTVVADGVDSVDGSRRWLVTSPPPGLAADAPASLADPGAAITRFARALRALHELPVAGCPFTASTESVLTGARGRVAAGLVDRERFQPAHRRYSPAELLAHVEAFVPLALSRPTPIPAAVITHGRAVLGHVILEPTPAGAGPSADLRAPAAVGPLAGGTAVDIGGAAGATAHPLDGLAGWRRLEGLGVGDPYRDLAVAAASLTRRFDAGALPPFFDAYGLPSPDPVRLELFVLLGEFS